MKSGKPKPGEKLNVEKSMGMSFFNYAITKTSRQAASNRSKQTKSLEDNNELLVRPV